MMSIQFQAMTVHWEPPRKEYQNGPIAGYKIVFKLKGGKRLATFSVDGDRRNYTFKGALSSILFYRKSFFFICTSGDVSLKQVYVNMFLIGRKEIFYLTTHSPHFIYGYMASDIW